MPNLTVSPDATGLSAFNTHPTNRVPLDIPFDMTDAPVANLVPVCPLPPEEFQRVWRRDDIGKDVSVPWYSTDALGIVRDPSGIPQTKPGFVSPLVSLPLHETAPAMMAGVHIAMGLAAAAWSFVSVERSRGGRDVVICLVEAVCPINDMTLSEAFCIAEHELQPARDRVSYRMLRKPGFAAEFAEAKAMMRAGCVFFPWYQPDGSIPG